MGKKNKKKRARLKQDCWDLDFAFYRWLSERLPVYLKEAAADTHMDGVILYWKDEQYTQRQLIKILIKKLKRMNDLNGIGQKYAEWVDDILTIWKILCPHMWW